MSPFLIGLFGFALVRGVHAEIQRFERLAAEDIGRNLTGTQKTLRVRAEVGPEVVIGDVYRVTLSGSKFSTESLPLFVEPERPRRGILRHFRVDLSDFRLRGLHVQRLQVDIPDSRFDVSLAQRDHKFRLSKSGTGVTRVEVPQEDLNQFILGKYREVTSLRTLLEHGRIQLDGKVAVLAISNDVSINAALQILDGSKIQLASAKIAINGRPATPAVAEYLLSKLNPVIDLNKDLGLNDAVQLQELRVLGGSLVAFGRAKVPDLPQK